MLAYGTVLIIVVFLFLVAGIIAAVRGAHGDVQNLHGAVSLSRRQTQRTRSELRTMRINAKHTKRARAMHDQIEAAQFAAIKARDVANDAAKIADTAAAHLAQLATREV